MMGSVFAVLINQQEVKQMKKIVALILCLAMVLSVVACGGSKQEPAAPASKPGVDAVAAGAQETTETIETTADTKFKENVIIGLEEDLTLLDPQQSNGTTNLMIRWMTHSTLVDLDLVNGGFLPDLAESWEQTSDTVWVFHLNPNATFQNGDPVKASDVVYTLNSARESSFTSDKVEWIKESRATDDHTVEVELTEPVQDILYYLAYATLSILDEAAVEADPEKGPNIGSGPYELTDWSYGDHTTLTRYENYWGELPKTKVFTFRIMPEASTRLIALQTGEIDVCMDPAAIELSYIIEDPNLTLLSKASEKTQYITLNVTKAPFDNELVRKAIAYAVNRDDIVAVAVEGRGTVTNTFFSEGFGCYSDVNIYSYDPAKAKELLAEAGYPDGLSITISVSGEEKKLQAQVLQEQLSAIGITASIEELDIATLKTKLKEADYEMSLYNWANDSSGPDNNVRPLLRSGSGSNRSHFADPYIDDLMDKALVELDEAKRLEMYHEIQEYVLDKAPIIPMYYNDLYLGVTKNMQNLILDPSFCHRFAYSYVVEG
jgi:peptide/nickel transport system substrate-binding protein